MSTGIKRSIHETGQDTNKLKTARKLENDEFYTPIEEVKQELDHWKDKIHNSNIICPCDYFVTDSCCGLKVIKTDNHITYYKVIKLNTPLQVDTELVEIHKDDFIKLTEMNPSTNILKYLLDTDYKSITATGYNPKLNIGIKFQDQVYSKYDLCITNPPFSKIADFMKVLLKKRTKKLDFIIITPYLNRVTPNVGVPLMTNKCYLGYTRHRSITFISNDNQKTIACDWITTYPDAQEEKDKTYLKNYDDPYIIMENITMKDGTHPIRMDNYRSIPDDYYGWVFCSIGALDEISLEEFEWYGTAFFKYFNKEHTELSPFNHPVTNDMIKPYFHGIIIRRKLKQKT